VQATTKPTEIAINNISLFMLVSSQDSKLTEPQASR
jgi:hypothetical protein